MQLKGVGRRYGAGPWIVEGVDLELGAGDVVRFAGGNGAGKSTLLRLIVGLARPTAGTITGRPLRVSYVPDRWVHGERLTASTYLIHMGRIRGLSRGAARARALELLERLDLVGGDDVPLRRLSRGNAQKVVLAQAFLVKPELLVLDEPYAGLDGAAQVELDRLIGDVATGGGIVALADHRGHGSTVTTRAYAVEGGAVVRLQDPDGPTVIVSLHGRPERAHELSGVAGVVAVDPGVDAVTVRVLRAQCDALLRAALNDGWSVQEVRE